jgi:hypothetical protein
MIGISSLSTTATDLASTHVGTARNATVQYYWV